MINKFILRRSTAQTAALELNDPASWTMERGIGVLHRVAITKIKNPAPAVKDSSADVPVMNGKLDLTESMGAPRYKNKTVEITIQTLPDWREWFGEMRDAFTALQGRLVDFAFDTPNDVEWYYTGRLAVDSEDEETGELTLKIDTQPFMKNVNLRRCQIPAATSLDRGTPAWTVEAKSSTATVIINDGGITVYGKPGDQVELTRAADDAKRYALAVVALRGGDCWFSGSKSRTLGVPVFSSLNLTLTIDGSYYAWTTENGADVFKPCLYLSHILTELTLDSDGNPIGADGTYGDDPRYDPHCAIVLPSNVRIRPQLYNFGEGSADILLDGTRVNVDKYSAFRDVTQYPEAVLPGIRADRSGETVTCILSAVGNSGSDTPEAEIRFREERLG